MAVESTFYKTNWGKPFNMAFCGQRAIRLHRVPKTGTRGLIPFQQGGLGGLPQVFFLILGASMCVFNGVFMYLGRDFSPFGRNLLQEKIFLVMQETECWTKLFSDSQDFFYFFSTACFFDIISPMSPQVLESTFSTDPWWSFKELFFRKDIHLVFSIIRRTPLHLDFGFCRHKMTSLASL